MAWCDQTTICYKNQCWPRSMTLHVVTRPWLLLTSSSRLCGEFHCWNMIPPQFFPQYKSIFSELVFLIFPLPKCEFQLTHIIYLSTYFMVVSKYSCTCAREAILYLAYIWKINQHQSPTKHNKLVCIFLGMCCSLLSVHPGLLCIFHVKYISSLSLNCLLFLLER